MKTITPRMKAALEAAAKEVDRVNVELRLLGASVGRCNDAFQLLNKELRIWRARKNSPWGDGHRK